MRLEETTVTLKNWEVTRSTYFGDFQRDHRYTIGQQEHDPNIYSILVTIGFVHGRAHGKPIAAYVERLVSGRDNDVHAVWERVDGFPVSRILMP
jgi:hypothetical protein